MDDESVMIADATAKIFADLADPQAANSVDYDDGPLWQTLVDAGLTRAWLPEASGGAGLSLAGGFEILRVAGHYACPVGLAETLLAGWALNQAGLDVPEGVLTLAPMRGRGAVALGTDDAATGQARSIAHAMQADFVVVAAAHKKVLMKKKLHTDCEKCECKQFKWIPRRPEEVGMYWLVRRKGFDVTKWRAPCKCKHGHD